MGRVTVCDSAKQTIKGFSRENRKKVLDALKDLQAGVARNIERLDPEFLRLRCSGGIKITFQQLPSGVTRVLWVRLSPELNFVGDNDDDVETTILRMKELVSRAVRIGVPVEIPRLAS